MTHKTTRSQYFRYKFDNFMAGGGRSIFIGLLVLFLGLFFLISSIRLVVCATVPNGYTEVVVDDIKVDDQQWGGGVLRNMYITFLQMTDPGNMAQDISSKRQFQFTAILAGMTGVIFLSALIAFITTALDQKINELKKGHSKVIEEDHTLILGWNERVLEILRELVIANESEDNPCVVILSDEDKEYMDDYLKLHLRNRLNTRVVTRSGSPSSIVNLEIASIDNCKSVIVLATCNVTAPTEEKASSDATVLKTILACIATRTEGTELSIVAEIFDSRSREIAEDISPNELTTVDTNDILSKILVQTSRSVGLSVVYSEIISFDGCEMYFHEADWGDITFGRLPYHFPDGAPMGILRPDGELLINPSVDEPLNRGDSILILAEDDSTIDFRKSPVATPRDFELAGGKKELAIEKELIIGWTDKIEIILEQFSDYVLEGSSVDIMLRSPSSEVIHEIERLQEELPKISIRLVEEDPLSREGLLAAEPFKYDNVIILSQGREGADEARTDSETIVILLMLRSIFAAHEEPTTTKLITEVLDSENQELVSRTGVNDFIISNRFISMLLAQISENKEIKRVYDNLFEEDGSEIYLKPASLYFTDLPGEYTYADMIAIAQKREEVCLGLKISDLRNDSSKNFGVKLIPEKTMKYELGRDDMLVVLAEDET